MPVIGSSKTRKKRTSVPFLQESPGVPWHLTGKQLEELILFRARKMNDDRVWSFGRYGVQASMTRDPKTARMKMQPIKSLPDFEGVIPPTGQQIIIEAKVSSGPSFRMDSQQHKAERQLRHMLNRSEMGALCWLVIHFNGRKLKTKTDHPFTVAMAVCPECEWLQDTLLAGEVLSRDRASLNGVVLEWNKYRNRDRKFAPDLSQLT